MAHGTEKVIKGMNVQSLNVGLLWHNFFSKNLGVSALSYAHALLIKDVLDKSGIAVKFTVFGHADNVTIQDTKEIEELFGCKISHVKYGAKDILKGARCISRELKQCDFLFDIGEGDSFSDIYGLKRFLNQCITKFYGKKHAGHLVLAPQTYGPFKSSIAKKLANLVSKSADNIYSRDLLSQSHYQQICVKEIKSFTDVAFALPFEKSETTTNVVKVGLNVSGLLYSKSDLNKGINLELNYKNLIHEIVEYFLNEGATVELVSHVSGKLKEEDDYLAALDVKSLYPEVVVVNKFKTPIEAKSYISRFDYFVGARMHATIAALSSGVAVLPIAYSMKFKGVFSALNYSWVTEPYAGKGHREVLQDVIDGFIRRDELQKDAVEALMIAKSKLDEYKLELRKQFSV